MTSKHECELECRCGQVFKADLYDSINVTLDPKLLTMLFAREINKVKCPKCKVESQVKNPLVFHDMKIDLMLVSKDGNIENLIKDLENKGLYKDVKKN